MIKFLEKKLYIKNEKYFLLNIKFLYNIYEKDFWMIVCFKINVELYVFYNSLYNMNIYLKFIMICYEENIFLNFMIKKLGEKKIIDVYYKFM